MSTPERAPVLGVVVPAHDEEELLGACLDGLRVAAARVAARARVVVLVVLDACRDGSERIVRTRTGSRRPGSLHMGALHVGSRNVGRARRAGCAALLVGAGPDWLSTTDADSVVPADWLVAHLDAHEQGWDALVGTVRVPVGEGHAGRARRWFRDVYAAGDPRAPHPHVHGANLGIRAGTYRAVGGFPPLVTGEDVALVERLDPARHRVLRTRSVPVTTSARRFGRAAGGFADDLRRLAPAAPAVRDVGALRPRGQAVGD